MHHMGGLFLDILCCALEQQDPSASCKVRIALYNAKKMEYPISENEWDSYDGILLPGSFSSARDTQTEWIQRLRQVLRQRNAKPALAICFGHQIYASAMDGTVMQCPDGPQAGRLALQLSKEGKNIFPNLKNEMQLYYTHGDMVSQLPARAVSLGGTGQEPILAAAYFSSEQQARDFSENGLLDRVHPIAITFQGHPEYASPELGTLIQMLDRMEQQGTLCHERRLALEQDAMEHYTLVEQNSILAMQRACTLLGWFSNNKSKGKSPIKKEDKSVQWIIITAWELEAQECRRLQCSLTLESI